MQPSELETANALINAYSNEWQSTMAGKRTVVKHWDERLCRPVSPSVSETEAALIALVESIEAAHSAGFPNMEIMIGSDEAVRLIQAGPSNAANRVRPLVADVYGFRPFFSTISIQSSNTSVTL